VRPQRIQQETESLYSRTSQSRANTGRQYQLRRAQVWLSLKFRDRRRPNGDIEWAAGKAMKGLTLAAQVAGVASTEVGPGSR